MANLRQEIRCPSCLHDGTRHGRIVHGYEIFVCDRCGLAFTFPRPTEDEVEAFYHSLALNENLYGGQSPTKRAFFSLCHQEIRKYMHSGRLLDFGCGDCCFLNEGDDQCFDLFGADLNAGVTKIQHKKNINFLIGDIFESRIESGYFDVIFTSATYEHFINPREMTKKFHDLLRPGGILFITSVPNYKSINIITGIEDWLINRPPAHINFFTKKSLSSHLETFGFEVKKCITYGFNIEPIIRRLRRQSSSSSLKELVEDGRQESRRAEKPVKVTNRLAASLYYRFPYRDVGDKLAIIARKRV